MVLLTPDSPPTAPVWHRRRTFCTRQRSIGKWSIVGVDSLGLSSRRYTARLCISKLSHLMTIFYVNSESVCILSFAGCSSVSQRSCTTRPSSASVRWLSARLSLTMRWTTSRSGSTLRTFGWKRFVGADDRVDWLNHIVKYKLLFRARACSDCISGLVCTRVIWTCWSSVAGDIVGRQLSSSALACCLPRWCTTS